jgi:hypothetical protein
MTFTKLDRENQDRIRFWIKLGCDLIAANTAKKDDKQGKDKILGP